MTILGLLVNSFDYYNIVKFSARPPKWVWLYATVVFTYISTIFGAVTLGV